MVGKKVNLSLRLMLWVSIALARVPDTLADATPPKIDLNKLNIMGFYEVPQGNSFGFVLDNAKCGLNPADAFFEIDKGESVESILARFRKELSDGCEIDELYVSERIDESSLKKILVAADVVKVNKKEDLTVRLNSPGGSVYHAFEMGKVIANNGWSVTVREGSNCFSSCVYLYAAGARRGLGGSVGIHRPFASDLGKEIDNYAEYLILYEKVTTDIKNYLATFGISPQFVDWLNVVPSDNIRILKEQELEDLGLGARNIARVEFKKARDIAKCGQTAYQALLDFQREDEACGNEGLPSKVCLVESFWTFPAAVSCVWPSYEESYEADVESIKTSPLSEKGNQGLMDLGFLFSSKKEIEDSAEPLSAICGRSYLGDLLESEVLYSTCRNKNIGDRTCLFVTAFTYPTIFKPTTLCERLVRNPNFLSDS